jgi:shikimate kinase
MPDRPLILTGFMGSGKSSVGQLLAQRLCRPFIDLDGMIVASTGKSVNNIFAEDGETAFRALESDCLERVLKEKETIIATGGGAVLAENNRLLMKKHGVTVNLTVSLQQVLKRLEEVADRPLFAGQGNPEGVRKLLEERERFYAEADIRIDTNGKSVEDVAVEILCFMKGLTA